MYLIFRDIEPNTSLDIGIKTLTAIMGMSNGHPGDAMALYAHFLLRVNSNKSAVLDMAEIDICSDLNWNEMRASTTKNLLWQIGVIAISDDGLADWTKGSIKIHYVSKIIEFKNGKLNERQKQILLQRCDLFGKESRYYNNIISFLIPYGNEKTYSFFIPYGDKKTGFIYYNIRGHVSKKKIRKNYKKTNIGFNLITKSNQIKANNWINDCLKIWNNLSNIFPELITKHNSGTKFAKKIENYLIAIHKGNFVQKYDISNTNLPRKHTGFSIEEIKHAIGKLKQVLEEDFYSGSKRKVRLDEFIVSVKRYSKLLNILAYPDMPVITSKYIAKHEEIINYIESKNIVLGYDSFSDNKKKNLDTYLQDIEQFGYEYLFDSHINYYTYACSNLKSLIRVYIEEFLFKFYEEELEWWVEDISRTIWLFNKDKAPFRAFMKHVASEKNLSYLPKITNRK